MAREKPAAGKVPTELLFNYNIIIIYFSIVIGNEFFRVNVDGHVLLIRRFEKSGIEFA